MIIRLLTESYTPECPSRAGGEPAVPFGIRVLQTPLPVAGAFRNTAFVSNPAYVKLADNPPNTIIVFVVWSYTADGCIKSVSFVAAKLELQCGVVLVELGMGGVSATARPGNLGSPRGVAEDKVKADDCSARNRTVGESTKQANANSANAG